MNGSPEQAHRIDRRLVLAIFGVLLASYAYFYQAGGWNENSRMDLVRALVDDHTIAIDRYQQNTGDKARLGSHYYSDKAPGLSIAALPAYALVRLLRPLTGSEHDFVVLASYLVTVLTVGIAGAWLGVLVYRAARDLGASPRGATIGALGYGLGTIAFPFSTMLFSHQLAALLSFGAFRLLWACRAEHNDKRSLFAGVLCSAAVLTEFPTAPLALIFAAYHARPDRRLRRLLTFGAGAFVPALVLVGYLTVAFGSPFSVGYGFLADPASRAEMHARGVFGLTLPKLGVIVELLIGHQRGLLTYCPILFLALLGFSATHFALSAGRASHPPGEASPREVAAGRREIFAAVAVVLYFLAFVSGYTWWQGGSSFGSRHLVPMLPFATMMLGRFADARPILTSIVAAVSIATMTIVTSVQPKPSENLAEPFWGAIWPSFRKGELAQGNICPVLGRPGGSEHTPFLRGAFHDSFNLGMVLGGRGKKTLLPLVALWLSAAFAIAQWTRRRPLESSAPEVDADHVSSSTPDHADAHRDPAD